MRGRSLEAVVCLIALAASSCARDREAEGPADMNGGQLPPGQPPPGQPPVQPPAPKPTIAFPTVTLAPRPSATQAAPPPTAAPASSAELADLFRAQDACLSNCDQFACMRIASAYRDGVGVPRDPLAGRRYAIHACLECGAPGVATEGQCPLFGVTTPATTPKKK